MNEIAFSVGNAFATKPFSGNPAATVILRDAMSEQLMRLVAAEIGAPATSFLTLSNEAVHVRWFTPAGREVELCGHGTIAAGHRLYELYPDLANQLLLRTSTAETAIARLPNGQIRMSLPARPVVKLKVTPAPVLASLTDVAPITAIYKGRDYIAVFEDPAHVQRIVPNIGALKELDAYALVAVAPSNASDSDYVCRFFKSDKPNAEDIANGACQAYVAPLMADLLQRRTLRVRYLSSRGGEMTVHIDKEDVELSAPCITVMTGSFRIPSCVV